MKSERVTEYFVRDFLVDLGYTADADITVSPQKTSSPTIQKCLKNASKSGLGIGYPEFIITSKKHPNWLIVIECKADKKFHASLTGDNYRDYAVDGVLNYAECLSKARNVIAIAVSGQEKDDFIISTFVWVKNASDFVELTTLSLQKLQHFLTFNEYIALANSDRNLSQIRFEDLISFSKEVHNYMRDYAKLSETEKPLLVSGVLIALMNNAFSLNYSHYDQQTELAEELSNAIGNEIERAMIPKAKKISMLQPYSFIAVHPELRRINPTTEETPLFRLISDIDEHVKPFIQRHEEFDVLGQFYGEFLRYTGGDKKGLGIVLTPKHITELFAKLANLTKTTVVLDICAGTAGYLIASMVEMLSKVQTETEKTNVRQNCLIGVEQQPNMYALAASNMILRGDGKANLYQGDCFDPEIIKEISDRAEIGMINPPYSQKGANLHELSFINQLLDCLKPNGTAIAIVPVSCAISPHPMREKMLAKHRLDAVMSMPDDLFYPIGIVPCIMIFTAHVPHEQNPYHKTWFGYWKDDGHIKTKHKGRVDGGKWRQIEKKWLDTYFNRQEIPGYSVSRKVTFEDEWCAEAYMETDYSDISAEDFVETMKKYVAFRILNSDYMNDE